MINLFLKGLTSAPDIFKKVMDHPVPNNYGDLKSKAISVVKSRQLVNALKRSTAPGGRFPPNQSFHPQYQPPTPSGPPL